MPWRSKNSSWIWLPHPPGRMPGLAMPKPARSLRSRRLWVCQAPAMATKLSGQESCPNQRLLPRWIVVDSMRQCSRIMRPGASIPVTGLRGSLSLTAASNTRSPGCQRALCVWPRSMTWHHPRLGRSPRSAADRSSHTLQALCRPRRRASGRRWCQRGWMDQGGPDQVFPAIDACPSHARPRRVGAPDGLTPILRYLCRQFARQLCGAAVIG